MNIRLALATRYLPSTIKRAKLTELLDCAARAFHAEPPATARRGFDDLLNVFAEFTAEHAERCLEVTKGAQITKSRLYEYAYSFGAELRRWLKPRTEDEFMIALELVYGIIGIDLVGAPSGHIHVKRCYFSRYYSPEVCQVMAAMDAGVAAGLWGGGDLVFASRITEGHDTCEAIFSFQGVLK